MQNTIETSGASSSIGLLISNLLTLIVALTLKWPLASIIVPYWIQSLVIGWYARKRILSLKNFSTSGFTYNDNPVPENEKGKNSTAFFFVIHYGFFHLIYLLFLSASAEFHSAWDFFWIAVCGFSYVFAQRKTCEQQIASDAFGRPNLGKLMFLPYLRILPMHLTLIFGMIGGSIFAIIFFMSLKTVADILLDKLDRRPVGVIKNS
jgi:hypothetical protein